MPDTDPQRVSVAQPMDAARWARRFRVPVERMMQAVEAVGEQPDRVAACLGSAWPDGYDGL